MQLLRNAAPVALEPPTAAEPAAAVVAAAAAEEVLKALLAVVAAAPLNVAMLEAGAYTRPLLSST